MSRLGNAVPYLQPDMLHALADRGAFYTTVNPTAGTGIAFRVLTAFDATKPLAVLKNTATAGGVRVYPAWLRLITSVVPAAATSAELTMTVDNVSRYTNGGSALVPAASSFVDAVTSVATLKFGAVVSPVAGASVKTIHRSTTRTVIPKVLDELLIVFGGTQYSGALADLAGASASRIVVLAAPVVLDGGESLLIHPWFPTNAVTAAEFELEMAHYEV